MSYADGSNHRTKTHTMSNTDIRRLTKRIRSEKCAVRRFRRWANVTDCT